MKTNRYLTSSYFICFIVLCCFFFVACDSRLDKDPLDEFTMENFWETEDDALLALTGVYRGDILTNDTEHSVTDWWSYHGLLYIEFASDNAYDRKAENAGTTKLSNGTNTATNDYVKNYWEKSYLRIARSNDFIENIKEVSIDDEKLQRLESEARLIRATQYFYLTQYWGDVPLVLEPLNKEEANEVEQTQKDEIVAFLINEFEETAEYLPKQSELDASEIGRLTKQAAWGFLGRLLLAEEKFEEASKVYKKIMDLGENEIYSEYADLFLLRSGTDNKEIIFSTQYMMDEA